MISFTQSLCRAIRSLATERAYTSSEEISRKSSGRSRRERHLHHMWMLRDSGGSNDEVLWGFQELIGMLPSNFRVTIIDTYESSSVLFILKLRMSWETFLRFENVIELHIIGVVIGTSLIRCCTVSYGSSKILIIF